MSGLHESASHGLILERIAEEVQRRRSNGDSASTADFGSSQEEYLRKYPELADEIRDLFAALELLPSIPSLQEDRLPEHIGGYKIVEEAGRGGMGVVYLAEETALGRRVALKVLPPTTTSNPKFLARFQREARAAARLHHPHIVPVHGAGADQGVYFYAMQYIDGEGLDETLIGLRQQAETEPSSGVRSAEHFAWVARIGAQAAEALEHAHRHGVVHRDIKPSNLLLDSEGDAWVADFGLCKTDEFEDLTLTGDVVGTLRYMAPERFEGKGDARSDIYGLGMTLFELVTLRTAFPAKDRAELLREITRGSIPKLTQIDSRIPRDLETIILRATSPHVEARYATAGEFASDLRAFLDGKPIAARQPGLAVLLWQAMRRNRLLSSIVLGAAALIVATTLIYLVHLDRTLLRTRALGLAAASAEAVAYDPMLSLLLAREAVSKQTTAETVSQLHRALAALHERGQLSGHEVHLMTIEESASSEWLLTLSTDRAQLWSSNLESARNGQDRTERSPPGPEQPVPVMSIQHPSLSKEPGDAGMLGGFVLENPTQVFTYGYDGIGRLWGLDGRLDAEMIGHEGHMLTATLSPDQELVFTAAQDNTVRFWDRDGRETFKRERPYPAISMACDPRSGHVLIGYSDGVLERLSASGELLWSGALSGAVDNVCFSLDGTRWAASARSMFAIGGDPEEPVKSIEGHADQVNSIAFSRDGERILTSSTDQTARLWNRQGELTLTLRGHGGSVTGACFSPGGEYMLTSSTDLTAAIWDNDGNPLVWLKGHEDSVSHAHFTPDGTKVVTASGDCTTRVWDLQPAGVPILRGHDMGLYSAVFAPSGRKVLTASRDATARVWNLEAQQELVLEHDNWLCSAEYLETDETILSIPYLGGAQFWNESGQSTSDLISPEGRFLTFRTTPGGLEFIVRGTEATAVLLDAELREITRFEGHDGLVWGASISQDGRFATTCSMDHTARVWNRDGSELATLRGHGGMVRSSVFSPNGELVVTASDDSTAVIWTRTGRLLARLRGHGGAILRAVFSPDGTRVLTASRDQAARLWDLDGTPVAVFAGHRGVVWSAEFSPDGTRIVTSSFDRTARVWWVEPADLLRLADQRAFRDFDPAERQRYADLLGH